MEIRNLTESDVEEIDGKIVELRKNNPCITSSLFTCDDKPGSDYQQLLDQLQETKEKVDALSRKFDLIFGGAVLIDGKFKKVNC